MLSSVLRDVTIMLRAVVGRGSLLETGASKSPVVVLVLFVSAFSPLQEYCDLQEASFFAG